MEKRTPHCPLPVAQALVRQGRIRSTASALTGAASMGLDFEGMKGVLLALSTRDFHKSMTTYADSRIWQDVYRPVTDVGEIYLKLTVVDDVLIVSFKEL